MVFWRRKKISEENFEYVSSEEIFKEEISYYDSAIKRYKELIQEYTNKYNEAMVKKNAYELALKSLNFRDKEG